MLELDGIRDLEAAVDEKQAHTTAGSHPLAVRACSGDARAFTELYERYCEPVRRFVRGRGASAHDAEDITAETFAAAWQHRHTFHAGDTPFSAWLFGIARRQAANAHRAEGRQRRRLEAAAREDFVLLPTNEDRQQEMELQSAIELILQHLDARQRRIVELRFLHDLPVAEVAAILDEPPTAVSQLQLRALERLRRVALPILAAALVLVLGGTAMAASDTALGTKVRRTISGVLERVSIAHGHQQAEATAMHDNAAAIPDCSLSDMAHSLLQRGAICLPSTGVGDTAPVAVRQSRTKVKSATTAAGRTQLAARSNGALLARPAKTLTAEEPAIDEEQSTEAAAGEAAVDGEVPAEEEPLTPARDEHEELAPEPPAEETGGWAEDPEVWIAAEDMATAG